MIKLSKSVKNIALAIAAAASVAPTNANATVSKKDGQQQTRQTGKDAISERPERKSGLQLRAEAGGFHVLGFNEGIPPHIYGIYHVRRGTHKKTNKR